MLKHIFLFFIFSPLLALEQKSIVIGVPMSLTGIFEHEGQEAKRGYDLWANWVNNVKGGIRVGNRRLPVELIYEDIQSNPDVAANVTRNLIHQRKVQFLLGPYSSVLTKVVSTIAEQTHTLLIAGAASADSIYKPHYQSTFGVMPPASQFLIPCLQKLKNLGPKTIVIFYADEEFSRVAAESAKTWAEKNGFKLLDIVAYEAMSTHIQQDPVLQLKATKNYKAKLEHAKKLNPDIFIGCGHFHDSRRFLTLSAEMDFWPSAVILTIGACIPEFAHQLGRLADDVIFPAIWDSAMNFSGLYLGSTDDYVRRYRAFTGLSCPPSFIAASATAAGLCLQAAIEKTHSLNLQPLRRALLELDIKTFYGPINFDKHGENKAKKVGVMQIIKGEGVLLDKNEVPVYPRKRRTQKSSTKSTKPGKMKRSSRQK